MMERYTLETLIKSNGETRPFHITDNKTGKLYYTNNADDLKDFLEKINNKQEDLKISIIHSMCENNTYELTKDDNAVSIREKYILNRQIIELIKDITQP